MLRRSWQGGLLFAAAIALADGVPAGGLMVDGEEAVA